MPVSEGNWSGGVRERFEALFALAKPGEPRVVRLRNFRLREGMVSGTRAAVVLQCGSLHDDSVRCPRAARHVDYIKPLLWIIRQRYGSYVRVETRRGV